uniref:Uncharacterized protein n=1 Tax=Rhizophora mucronata TaxID=61149 RepID=A0A2P2QKA7_RHIMU
MHSYSVTEKKKNALSMLDSILTKHNWEHSLKTPFKRPSQLREQIPPIMTFSHSNCKKMKDHKPSRTSSSRQGKEGSRPH